MGDRADAIHSFLESYDSGASSGSTSIPVQRQSITCCCGNPSCAFLQHNHSALDGLERQVHTAASLGKALLVRHEAYIADSERERRTMTLHIEELEGEKKALEEKNAHAIEENRSLLDQLETLNNAVAESDTQVINLQATLRSTQQELHKLSNLAARTESLEQQLAEFEREQVTWHSTLEEKETSEKSALRRWQQAERTLAGLQEQIERIEHEAKEENARHVEVLARMERKHAVERELGTAAGRLKGAAALKATGADGNETNVVSHFVKDILQDNANLQMGIIELRDMLQTSNEEVETLREQLSVHQPVPGDDIMQPASVPLRPVLNEEMRRATSSELHVHHHYHAPPAPAPIKAPVRRASRSKKKRYGSLSGYGSPPSGASTPRFLFPQGSPSTMATILAQTAASLPESSAAGKRWSVQSNHTYASTREFCGPSSPGSTHRASSVFDRVFSDAGQDSSRPTTPGTEEPGSPILAPMHSKRSSRSSYHAHHASSSSHRNRPSLDSILDMSAETLRHIEQQNTSEAVIPEEDEVDWEEESHPSTELESDAISPFSEELEVAPHGGSRPFLRRAASHESILSVSGLDIHTLKSRPSQLLTPHGSRNFTTQAVITDATAHAVRPIAIGRPSVSSTSLLNGIAPMARQSSAEQASSTKPGLGSKVGGWVFGRWGTSPELSNMQDNSTSASKTNRTASIASGSTGRSGEDPQATPRKPLRHRPPGINQAGPIFGLRPETKLQHPPIMNQLDQDALERALGNGG